MQLYKLNSSFRKFDARAHAWQYCFAAEQRPRCLLSVNMSPRTLITRELETVNKMCLCHLDRLLTMPPMLV